MSEKSGEGHGVEPEQHVPAQPLPLTDDETAALDKVIESIPSRMRRRAIMFDRPRFMEKEPESLAKLDTVIMEVLKELKPKVPEDVAEKLFDRVTMMSVQDRYEDEQSSLGVFCLRLMDTMLCMIAIKEKYRDRKCTSKYDKKYATEQLRARGLLRK